MSVKASFKITIPRRSSSCGGCAARFDAGDRYVSLVNEDEESPDGFIRHDYCSPCWEKEDPSVSPAVQWKGRIPPKKVVDPYADLSRDERAFAILREVLASEEEGAAEEAFVLALYLGRKRQLLTRKLFQQEGHQFQLYEVSKTEEMLAVPHFDLATLDISAVQKRVAEKMKGEKKSQSSGGSHSGREEQLS